MIIRDFTAARHLAARLEIGVDNTLCQSRVGLALEQVFSTLLPADNHVIQAPTLTDWQETATFYSADIAQQRKIRIQAATDADQLSAWWLRHIHHTEYPLLERMTLFWHSHFATNMDKVAWPQLMLRQNQLLHKHALGNFADLLRAMLRDSALLLFLDSSQNQAKALNDNFAHALLAHFTVGAGHFSADDVTATARAFTGWQFEPATGEFQLQLNQHDKGEKTFRGHSGNFSGDDIIDILLQEARTAEYITEKFWAAFINHATPDPEFIQAWATEFRDSGYEIQSLLQAIIHSPVFWDRENRGALIKSPIELSVGLLRELDIPLANYAYLRKANQQLGQDLLRPPDAQGWPVGSDWINNASLSRRYDLIVKLLAEHSDEQPAGRLSVLMDKAACFSNENEVVRWLLPLEPAASPNCEQPPTDRLLTLLKDPVYQLR